MLSTRCRWCAPMIFQCDDGRVDEPALIAIGLLFDAHGALGAVQLGAAHGEAELAGPRGERRVEPLWDPSNEGIAIVNNPFKKYHR